MKLPRRLILLRILAAAAMGVFLYSCAVTLRVILFGKDGGLLPLLFFASIMLIGHISGGFFWGDTPAFASRVFDSKFAKLFSFMMNIKDGARFTAAMTAWAVIFLPVLASLLIYRKQGILRIAFEILLAMVAYIMSLKHSRLDSTQIMNNRAAFTGFFFLVLGLEVQYFVSSIAYLRPWLFITSYFFILVYLIIRNQEDIDSNIFNKKHVEKSILPKNLRRFNTLYVFVVFLTIILFFNLKPVILYILQILGDLTILIIKGVFWILKHILPSQEVEQQSGTAAQSFDFFGDSTEIVYPYKNLLFNIVKNFVILYLAYRILLYLIRKLPGLVRWAVGWIKKLLSIKKTEKSFEAMDFSDEIETLKPVRIHINQNKLKKNMRKSRRDLRGISDPVERIRHMYSSVINMLPLIGVQPEICDTTMDILSKTASSGETSKELSPLTAIYNQVRYGDKIPDRGMLTEAEGHFDKAVDVIGQK